MAGFLPEHLPFDRGISPAYLLGRTSAARNESSPSLKTEPHCCLTRRKSILSVALEQIAHAKLFNGASSSNRGYTVSRGSDSIDGLSQHFRCDILAVSAGDYRSAEAECKQLVVEAGGTIFEHLRYPRGFLFELSCLVECPLETGDRTVGGGTIVVELFEFFDHHHSAQRKSTDEAPLLIEPKKKHWNFKAANRLQKKYRPVVEPASPPNTSVDSYPRCLVFDNRRITVVEMLLEEAMLRRGNSVLFPRRPLVHQDEGSEWETLSEEDE